MSRFFPLLLIASLLAISACAVLKPPFHTRQKRPSIKLETTQVLPGKLFLKLSVHAPRRIGPEVEVFRSMGDDEFQLWKSIKVSEFEKELHEGLALIDDGIEYGQQVYYQARSQKAESIFLSEELSVLKEKGPNPPENLRTSINNNTIKIQWDQSANQAFSHVIIYRRNIVEDSPLEMVSNLVKDGFWVDENVVPNGVYSYQIVSAKLQQSALIYGPFSEPLYVTVE